MFSKENLWGVGLMLIGAALAVYVGKVLGVVCGVLGVGIIIWAQVRRPPTLPRRAYKLADDLVAIQREQGPEPPHPLSGRSGGEVEQRRVFNAYFDWQQQTYRKYMARCRDQVVQIDRDFAAEGIFTKLDPKEIDPPETSVEIDLPKIIQALRSAADQAPVKK